MHDLANLGRGFSGVGILGISRQSGRSAAGSNEAEENQRRQNCAYSNHFVSQVEMMAGILSAEATFGKDVAAGQSGRNRPSWRGLYITRGEMLF
jgi:hypothetical protein